MLSLSRSTWDYQEHLTAFKDTLNEIQQSGTKLFNSLAMMLWNCDKRYLRDMSQSWHSNYPLPCGLTVPVRKR